MTNPKRLIETDDWQIGIRPVASVSFVLTLAGDKWTFYSPRLHYACYFNVPRAGVGLSIGAELPVDPGPLADNLASQHLSLNQEHITIEHAFSANSLDGGSVGTFSVGARGVVAGAEGYQTSVRTRSARMVLRIHGGSVSLGLGVEVNMGSLAMGALYGPYDMPLPPRILKRVASS